MLLGSVKDNVAATFSLSVQQHKTPLHEGSVWWHYKESYLPYRLVTSQEHERYRANENLEPSRTSITRSDSQCP